MTVEYTLWEGQLSEARQSALLGLIHRVFGEAGASSDAKMSWRFAHMPVFSCFCAADGARIVGFKAGYALKAGHYYSWLGGVDPDYRRQGIANELMFRQHSWLREQGYEVVETGAVQDNHGMSTLNLQSGFTVVGRRSTPHGLSIIYEKRL